MARRKKKKKRSRSDHQPPADRNQSSQQTTAVLDPTSKSDVAGPQSSSFRRLFIIAVLLVGFWWLLLGGMALFTANPVSLNREQVNRSALIITARISDPDSGTVRVVKVWKGQPEAKIDVLEDLGLAGAKRDRTYIIPVTESEKGRFSVTKTNLPRNPPLIYPATPEAEQQLTELLEQH